MGYVAIYHSPFVDTKFCLSSNHLNEIYKSAKSQAYSHSILHYRILYLALIWAVLSNVTGIYFLYIIFLCIIRLPYVRNNWFTLKCVVLRFVRKSQARIFCNIKKKSIQFYSIFSLTRPAPPGIEHIEQYHTAK